MMRCDGQLIASKLDWDARQCRRCCWHACTLGGAGRNWRGRRQETVRGEGGDGVCSRVGLWQVIDCLSFSDGMLRRRDTLTSCVLPIARMWADGHKVPHANLPCLRPRTRCGLLMHARDAYGRGLLVVWLESGPMRVVSCHVSRFVSELAELPHASGAGRTRPTPSTPRSHSLYSPCRTCAPCARRIRRLHPMPSPHTTPAALAH